MRSSNGWGSITRARRPARSFNGTPIFYTATLPAADDRRVPPIHSEYQSQSFEMNDTIRWKDWTFNLGLLASNDTLYGQGLQRGLVDALRLRRRARATEYKMYEIPFSKMMQPRVGATWAYNGKDTVYASYARYNPAASSLPRAASWDRNLATTINAYFDAERRALRRRPRRAHRPASCSSTT